MRKEALHAWPRTRRGIWPAYARRLPAFCDWPGPAMHGPLVMWLMCGFVAGLIARGFRPRLSCGALNSHTLGLIHNTWCSSLGCMKVGIFECLRTVQDGRAGPPMPCMHCGGQAASFSKEGHNTKCSLAQLYTRVRREIDTLQIGHVSTVGAHAMQS